MIFRGMEMDPLTVHWYVVLRYRRRNMKPNAWDDDCDCGSPPSAHHLERCSITPIYAQLQSDLFGHENIHALMFEDWWTMYNLFGVAGWT